MHHWHLPTGKILSNKSFISVLPGLTLVVALLAASVVYGQNVSAVDYTMNITTSGSRSINVSPRADGVGTSISADNINVQTTCRAGYNLTASTSVNNNNLYLDGDIANNASGTYFSPASGSSTLKNSPNTWGYLVSDTTPNENSTFSPVPALGATATIKTPVSSTADIDDHFNVYYGVSVANGMNTGTYKMIPDTSVTPNKDGAIVYYLTMADACTSYTVHYNPTGADQNGTLRIGTGTVADQSIKTDIATNLTTSTFTAPTGYYFQGWNTAQDGSGTFYAKGQSVTNLENATVGDTVTLYAMWTDCPSSKICYDPVASGVTDTMADQTVGNTATTIDLWPSNFQRSGYGFAGWNTKADGSGNKYGPMQTLDLTAGQYSSGGLHLYAMWVEPAKDGSNNPLTMQNWTGCSSMSIGDVTALTDNRDNNTYAVAKLADEKCWMIENLRLDDTPELTAANTNSPSLPLNNSWYYKNQQSTLTTSNHLSATSDPTQTTPTDTAWCTTNSTNCDDQSMLATNNTTLAGTTENSMTAPDANVYSYGNYYNWYSATAGHGKYSTDTNVVASGDLCPAGWQLPYGGSGTGEKGGNTTGGFYYLGRKLGATTDSAASSKIWRSYPNNFLYSGYVDGSSVYSRGSYGEWWSSTAGGARRAYYLGFNSSVIYPGSYNTYKYPGNSVRCLAQ